MSNHIGSNGVLVRLAPFSFAFGATIQVQTAEDPPEIKELRGDLEMLDHLFKTQSFSEAQVQLKEIRKKLSSSFEAD